MNEDDRLIGVGWNHGSSKILNNLFVLSNRKVFVLGLAEIILGLNVIIGDYYIFDNDKLILFINKHIGLSQRLIRALMDNGSHSFIGLLSWFIVTYPNLSFKELLISAILSSIIDLDHFISAKSFYLIDAISLQNRPFLHNSLTLISFNLIAYVVFKLFVQTDRNWAVLIFVSWFSHHVRDANRRGLWFGSLYTTLPIKDSIYLLIILILPLLLRYAINANFDIFNISNFISNYNQSKNSIDVIKFKREVHLV